MIATEEDAMMANFTAYAVTKYLYVYVSPVIVVVGFVGNSLSFFVLVQPSMRRVSTYCYLIVLAVADTIVLGVGLLPKWIDQTWNISVQTLSELSCRASYVLLYTISDYTVWLIIAVTVERYVAVCHPLVARVVCRRRRAVHIMVGLFVVLLALNAHLGWAVGLHYQTDSNTTDCDTLDERRDLITFTWPWIDAAVYSFLPFAIIVTFNSLIIGRLVSARRQRDQLSSSGGGSTVAVAPPPTAASLRSTGGSRQAATGAPPDDCGRGVGDERRRIFDDGIKSGNGSGRRTRGAGSSSRGGGGGGGAGGDRRSRRLIVMLLTVSFTFLAATLPRCAVLILISPSTGGLHESLRNPTTVDDLRLLLNVRLAYAATELLMYANHAINFFLYCATGQKFRRQLVRAVCGSRCCSAVARCMRLGGPAVQGSGRSTCMSRAGGSSLDDADDECVSLKSPNDRRKTIALRSRREHCGVQYV